MWIFHKSQILDRFGPNLDKLQAYSLLIDRLLTSASVDEADEEEDSGLLSLLDIFWLSISAISFRNASANI